MHFLSSIAFFVYPAIWAYFTRALANAKTVLLGLCINMLSFLVLTTVSSGWVMLASIPFIALGSMASPALSALMSQTTDDNQQGELQGLLASVDTIGMFLPPILMTQSFSYFISPNAPIYLPGAPFYLSMALIGIYIVIFLSANKPANNDHPL